MNKVTQKTCTSKKVARDRRIPAKARRENGGKPAPAQTHSEPKEPPDDETTVPIRRYELERLDGLLARAQDVVLRAAPGFNWGIPSVGLYGNSAAVSAHSDIRMVREELAKALGVPS